METVAPSLSKKQLERLGVGLFMMTVFTAIWVTIAEIAFMSRDHGTTAGAFGIVIIFFIINYIKIMQTAKEVGLASMEADEPVEKSRAKWFYVIFAVEGVAILVIKNILVNKGHDDLFVPFFALIVGLHFFPMAWLLKRPFFYFLGTWMSIMAALGFFLLYKGEPVYLSTGLIGLGCALATTANGIRLIKMGGVAWLGGM